MRNDLSITNTCAGLLYEVYTQRELNHLPIEHLGRDEVSVLT